MRIGISFLTHAGQSVWENGLGQQVFFLVQLLRGLPCVADVVLLDCGDQAVAPPGVAEAFPALRLVPARDATDLVDVVIEMGGGLDTEWLDYMRALGKKVVLFCVGQPYVGLIEPTIFNKNGAFARAQPSDEVWILPKDRVFKPMLEALHRCVVHEAPFLWSPVFVDQRTAEVERAGFRFGYEPRHDAGRPRALRAAVFQPNVSMVKSCVIPMLVCEAADRVNAQVVSEMHVLNSIQMKEHPTFVYLSRSLGLYQSGRVRLEQRHDFVGYMSQFADAVVAHQFQNDQNILYLDALYGGYPLIHNSPWLEEVGYYYGESDVAGGAMQLINASLHHDADHGSYASDARAFLSRLSPHDPTNGAQYAGRLLHLHPPEPGRVAAC